MKKGGVHDIAVREKQSQTIAKIWLKEAKTEAIELHKTRQLGAGGIGGADALIPSAKIYSYETMFCSGLSHLGLHQIDFGNAINLVKQTQLLSAVFFRAHQLSFFLLSQAHTPILHQHYTVH